MLSDTEYTVLAIMHQQEAYTERSQFKPQIVALTYFVNERATLGFDFTISQMNIGSDRVNSIISTLEEQGYIATEKSVTFGLDTRIQLFTTHEGDSALQLTENKKLELIVSDVCEEYGSAPISNLITEIYENQYVSL